MTFEVATPQLQRASPDYAHRLVHRAVSTTPANRTGAFVDCFPIHAAFPGNSAGRRSHLDFRGLLGIYSRYGPMFRSTAQGGLCHEASTKPVTRPSRSSATRAIDNSPGGIFLHWLCTPSGRTNYCDNALNAIRIFAIGHTRGRQVRGPDLTVCTGNLAASGACAGLRPIWAHASFHHADHCPAYFA
jgi:hypothetical protein